ncbi:MAG: hypothetical protein WD381_05725 [Balneolaceae bacterium]
MIRILLVIGFLWMGFAEVSEAQTGEQIPREYVNPEEMISFDRRTDFQDAIEVLSTYSQDFDGRFILDRTGTTGAIGVSLPAMHWKDALNYIMRIKNLVVLESPEFFEIVTEEEASPADTQSGRQGSAGAVDEDEINISTGTREIRINATFFEGNKRALQEIGVDWSTLTNAVPDNIQDFLGEDGSETIPSSEFGDEFVSISSTGAQNVSQSVFSSIVNFGDIGGGINVQALFSAFEADNLGKILATPSIKVMDGQEGRIQVGEDFSIKQRDFAGNVTDQFFSTGTILNVMPQIVEVGDTTLIYLELETERSSAQPDPVSTIISKQQANTHALLIDGESTVIAGLYRTETADVRRGIPILKDLPGWFFGLKYLFGYNSTDVSESELIVLLQAELEDPISDRISRSFSSKGQLLGETQNLNRNLMDYISDKSPVEPENVSKSSVQPDSPEMDIGTYDQSNVTDDESESEFEPYQRPTARNLGLDTDDLRARAEYAGLTQAELDRLSVSEYSGEWRSMKLENMNGDYSNLNFYVIGGSFTVKSNADGLYNSFKQQGFDAHILYNPATDYYFVAYKGFEDPDESIQYLRQIQRDEEPTAWLSRLIREERRLDMNGAR